MRTPNLRLLRKPKTSTNNNVFQPPGTISYVGEKRTEEVTTETIAYNKTSYEKQEGLLEGSLDSKKVYWFNVDGIHNTKLLAKIGKKFGVHHLLLEDIANTTQRPKTEFYADYIYQCIKMISYDPVHHEMSQEQVSILLTKNTIN